MSYQEDERFRQFRYRAFTAREKLAQAAKDNLPPAQVELIKQELDLAEGGMEFVRAKYDTAFGGVDE
jgi:hypothetical protein